MHASCHSLITRELLHDWLSVASAARRYIWGASLANGMMILRGFLAVSKISSSVHSTLRRIAIEIEISPFTRLLAVKVATRATLWKLTMRKWDSREAFSNYCDELTLLLILYDVCTMKQTAWNALEKISWMFNHVKLYTILISRIY